MSHSDSQDSQGSQDSQDTFMAYVHIPGDALATSYARVSRGEEGHGLVPLEYDPKILLRTGPTYADVRVGSQRGSQPCDEHKFAETGMPEGDPALTICEYLVNGNLAPDKLHAGDRSTLLDLFDAYKRKYPQDRKAGDIQHEDILAIAKFLYGIYEIHKAFLKLRAKRPDSKIIGRLIENGNLYEIVRFMRGRLKRAFSYIL